MADSETLPTLKSIADAAGVSIATVSRVLNNRGGVGEDSRRKIIAEAQKMGYQLRAARTLLKAGVKHALLVIPSQIYSGSSFYEEVLNGLLDEAALNSLKLDVRLVTFDAENALEEIDRLLEDVQPDAFLALGFDHPRMIDRIVEAGIPAVIVNGMDRTMRLSCVLPDNWAAGWLAAQHLLAAGHREIVHVTYPRRLSLQRRLDGFSVALEEAGIRFDPARHVFDLGTLGMPQVEVMVAIRKAFRAHRFDTPTAFFCGNDHIAIAVMQALADRGDQVPDRYSIVGIDDISISRHSAPPLTTMRIDRAELGRMGVQLLLERITDPEAAVKRINLGVQLVQRDSVGPPRSI